MAPVHLPEEAAPEQDNLWKKFGTSLGAMLGLGAVLLPMASAYFSMSTRLNVLEAYVDGLEPQRVLARSERGEMANAISSIQTDLENLHEDIQRIDERARTASAAYTDQIGDIREQLGRLDAMVSRPQTQTGARQ